MSRPFPHGPHRGRIRQEIEAILDRASLDADFRQLCLSDPAEAIRQATGVELPEDFTVRFVDSQGADMTIVLRDMGADDEELSDDDLDLAAGGGGSGAWW